MMRCQRFLFRPFRAMRSAFGLPRAALRGFTAALCPGLICCCPVGAEMRNSRLARRATLISHLLRWYQVGRQSAKRPRYAHRPRAGLRTK